MKKKKFFLNSSDDFNIATIFIVLGLLVHSSCYIFSKLYLFRKFLMPLYILLYITGIVFILTAVYKYKHATIQKVSEEQAYEILRRYVREYKDTKKEMEKELVTLAYSLLPEYKNSGELLEGGYYKAIIDDEVKKDEKET